MVRRGLPAGEGVRDPSEGGLEERSREGPGAGRRAPYGVYEVDGLDRVDETEPLLPLRLTIGGKRMSLAVSTGYSEFESPDFGSILDDGGGGDGEEVDGLDEEGSFAGGPRWIAGFSRGSIGPSGGKT